MSRSFQNGTHSMKEIEKVFTRATELCDILRECKKSGVSWFKWGDLEVRFGTTSQSGRQIKISEKAISESEKIEIQAIEQQEILTKEDQLDHMLIEDPYQYEKLLLAGELENGRTEQEEVR